jgi:hypothetical protein
MSQKVGFLNLGSTECSGELNINTGPNCCLITSIIFNLFSFYITVCFFSQFLSVTFHFLCTFSSFLSVYFFLNLFFHNSFMSFFLSLSYSQKLFYWFVSLRMIFFTCFFFLPLYFPLALPFFLCVSLSLSQFLSLHIGYME